MKLTSILLAVTAALIIAACGDDDDAEPQALTAGASGATGEDGTAGTKAAFIAAADEICREGDQAYAREARAQYPEGPPTGDDAVAFAEDVLIPNLQAQHDGIADIPPPPGEEEAVADLLGTFQAGIDELAADPVNFVESTVLEDAGAAATDLGLKECGA